MNRSNITERLNAVAISRPRQFTVCGKSFSIHPQTLGKALVMASYMAELKMQNAAIGMLPAAEAVMLCLAQPDVVCTILALSCTSSRDEVLNADAVAENADFMRDNLSVEDMASLLLLVFQEERAEELMELSGIKEEQHQFARVSRRTASGKTVTYGGVTIFGQLIDAACQRYSWTFDYVMWGVPMVVLKLMLADAVTSTYLSEEEAKRLHLEDRNDNKQIINAETTDINTLRKMTEG